MATTDTVAEDSARLDRFGRGVVETFAVALTLGAVAWAADLYRAIGLVLFTEQFLAAMLGLALPIVFVNVPATRGGTGRLPWYDTIAAVAAFVACWYVAWTYPRLSNELVYHPPDALVVSAVLLVLIVEGLRRAVGKVLVILLLAFLAYAMWGHHIPGKLTGREVDTATIVIGLALDPQALLGVPMQIATTIVIAFVLLGHVLFESGGSSFFTGISMATMGRYRGGSAKIAVTASALFGSISGSAVSNVVSTGVITIPLMREAGYSSEAAGGIEAVASTGGQLMPPIMGASAFVMAEFLQIAYAEVVIAALVPAVLYYAALFIVSDLEAGRTRIARVEEHALPRARAILKAGWFFPLPFGVLVYALFGLHQRPEAAALYATLSLLACTATLGYQGRRTGLGTLMKAVRQTGHACIDIILIVAAAGLVIGVLNISGLSFGLTLTLVQIGQGQSDRAAADGGRNLHPPGHGNADAWGVCAARLAGRACAGRGRGRPDGCAPVRSLLRHDVDDYAADRDCRLRRRVADPRGSHAYGARGLSLRLARIRDPVSDCRLADTDHARRADRDRCRRCNCVRRRVVGIGRANGVLRARPWGRCPSPVPPLPASPRSFLSPPLRARRLSLPPA